MPSIYRFSKKYKFTKNLENYVQLIDMKEFKLQLGPLDSDPGTPCSMKQKGIF